MLRRLGGPCERGGVVIQVTPMAIMMPLLVSSLRESSLTHVMTVNHWPWSHTATELCAGAESASGRESRKVAEGRVEEENTIRGGAGRPVRSAIYVAKDAKSAH